MDPMRVENAIKHAKKMLELYESIPGGSFGAAFIKRDLDLVESGDHSEQAIKRLEDIE
jgi:hypothetical protein